MKTNLRPLAFRWNARLDNFITDAAWSPDGDMLAIASVSGQAALYAPDGEPLQLWKQAHADGCDALAWRPDGQALATAGRDGTWKLWSPGAVEPLAQYPAGALWVEHLAWSTAPHGPRLAVAAGNKVTVWDADGKSLGAPQILPRAVAALTWVGGQLAVATSAAITLRDPLTGEDQRGFPSPDAILNLAFSPSGKWLMAGTQDCGIHVWNTEGGGEMHMRGYAAKVRQLAWHRGSRWMATGGGEVVSVWDCSGRGPEGRTPTLLEWHPDLITALHYQPAGDWLASGARDGSVAVWSPTQRHPQISGAKISHGVTRVAWAPDGSQFLATGEDGEIQMFELE